MTSHHLTKTIAARLFPLCIAGMILFSGCGSDPQSASTLDSNSQDTTPQTTTQELTDTASHTTEGQERKIFDDYVGGYEVENGIDTLVDTDQSIHQDFFDSISTEGYTLTFAKEDQQTVSEVNAPLLEEYITYLADLASQHDSCGFDDAVKHYLESHPDIALDTEDGLVELYEGIRFDYGIPPEDVESWGCDNEYAAGFIEYWTAPVEHTSGLTEEQLRERETLSEEDWKRAEEEADRAVAEFKERQRKDLEERQRWMEENWDEIGSDM